MDWYKHMTKQNGLIFNLVSRYGSDGYHVYFKTVELLAEGNHFYKPLEADLDFFYHVFICVEKDKILDIFRYLASKDKMTLTESGEDLSIWIAKLEEMNPEYSRKHKDIIESQEKKYGRKADGRRTEDGRKADGVEVKEVKKVKEPKTLTADKPPSLPTAINVFKEYYLKYRKIEYIPNYGKDGKLLKTLLTNITEVEYKELLDKFFTSTEKFIVGSDYGVGVFNSQVNKLRAEAVDTESLRFVIKNGQYRILNNGASDKAVYTKEDWESMRLEQEVVDRRKYVPEVIND